MVAQRGAEADLQRVGDRGGVLERLERGRAMGRETGDGVSFRVVERSGTTHEQW